MARQLALCMSERSMHCMHCMHCMQMRQARVTFVNSLILTVMAGEMSKFHTPAVGNFILSMKNPLKPTQI